jgi:hypothetical protein
MSDYNEQNAKSLERIAESLEAISLFLTVLMGEDQAEQTGPAANYITTQDGIVELR